MLTKSDSVTRPPIPQCGQDPARPLADVLEDLCGPCLGSHTQALPKVSMMGTLSRGTPGFDPRLPLHLQSGPRSLQGVCQSRWGFLSGQDAVSGKVLLSLGLFPLSWSPRHLFQFGKQIIYGLFLTPDHRCPSFINLSLFLLSAIAHNWSTFKMSLILVLQCHNLTVIGVASTGSPGPEMDGVQLTNYILSI